MVARPREEIVEAGKAQYRTRFRQIVAVKNHLIGLGVPDVSVKGAGYSRNLAISGFNAKVVRNLRRDFDKYGRRETLHEMTDGDVRPLVVFEVPLFAEDPDEILVTMPIGTFANIIIEARSGRPPLRKE